MTYIVKIIVGVVMEINLKNILLWLSFIIWFIYCIINAIYIIKRNNTLKVSYFEYLKKNFLQVFRLDKLILIIVFYLYTRLKNTTVNIYLFLIIMLYFLVNLFYEEKVNQKFNFKKDWFSLLIMILIFLIPIIYYLFKMNKVMTTYLMMLGIFYFEQILFLIPIFLRKLVKKK